MPRASLGIALLALGCSGEPRPAATSPAPVVIAAPAADAPAPAGPSASASVSPPPEPPPDVAKGARGHRVTRDGDALVLRDAAGREIAALGAVRDAAFDAEGKILYAWGETRNVLLEVATGKTLTERARGLLGSATFLPGGARLLEIEGEGGLRIVEVPSLASVLERPGGHAEYHQTARRALVIADVEPRPRGQQWNLRLFVIDTEAARVLTSIPFNEAVMNRPRFAFSADGMKLGWARVGASVLDLSTGNITVLERSPAPEHDRYAPSAPYFSADGNSVCIEQEGAVRAISIHPVPRGRKRHCLLVPRSREGEPIWDHSYADLEAMLVDVPLKSGTAQPSNLFGLYFEVVQEAVSPDRARVAVLEQTPMAGPLDTLDTELLICDAQTGDVQQRIPLGPMPGQTYKASLSFSRDGKVVTFENANAKKVLSFDVATGNPVATPVEP